MSKKNQNNAPKAKNINNTKTVEDMKLPETNPNALTPGTKIMTSLGEVTIGDDGKPKLRQGRPTNPNSERHKRLEAQAERKAAAEAGEIKFNKSGDLRGRPPVEGSDRAKKMAERESKLAAGIELKQGRPVKENSERQQKLKARMAQLQQIEAEIMSGKAQIITDDIVTDVDDNEGAE